MYQNYSFKAKHKDITYRLGCDITERKQIKEHWLTCLSRLRSMICYCTIMCCTHCNGVLLRPHPNAKLWTMETILSQVGLINHGHFC